MLKLTLNNITHLSRVREHLHGFCTPAVTDDQLLPVLWHWSVHPQPALLVLERERGRGGEREREREREINPSHG